MLTVENIHGAHHDIWSVNVEEAYHEVDDRNGTGPTTGTGAGAGSGGRDAPGVPRRPDRSGRAVT